jgi:hypothetical protein
MKWCALLLLAASLPGYAKSKPAGAPCQTGYFSIIEKDNLGNVNQGAYAKLRKWLDGDLSKKYPDVCYAVPNPSIHTVLVIIVTPDTYHGTRIVFY